MLKRGLQLQLKVSFAQGENVPRDLLFALLIKNLLYPLERFYSLSLTELHYFTEKQFYLNRSLLLKLFSVEGPQSLTRGILLSNAFFISESLLWLGSFEYLKSSKFDVLAAGVLCNFVAGLALHPLQVLTRRMQNDSLVR